MDWRFSTYLLILFALLIGFSWGTSEDGLCHSRFVIDVLNQKNKDGALNCFEFWFNRYQTLIGTVAAAAAAYLAWRGVQGQIRIAARQTSAGMIDPLRARLDAAEATIKNIAAVRDAIYFCEEEIDDCKHYLVAAISYFNGYEDGSINAATNAFNLAVEGLPRFLGDLENKITAAEKTAKILILVGQEKKEFANTMSHARLAHQYYWQRLSRFRRLKLLDQPWGTGEFREIELSVKRMESSQKSYTISARQLLLGVAEISERLEVLLSSAIEDAEQP